ncbi:MAG: VWA domain-containing protein [Phycisphaerae bacterium]|jgi:hypothetical protein|nr:VWA domain-containing protein [Phycisphaerae bacterium]
MYRKARTYLIVAVVLSVVVCAAEARAQTAGPKIQVAILLDNSGSMSGLINQAKAQLWKFINEFATTKKGGQVPEIQVALYIYGNPPPRLILPLTNDLDRVSEKLFAVTISGGTENCGQVIKAATEDLKWSTDPGDLKVIFIAGNEPFTQGPVDYREACKAAITKGIVVNTIHCGPYQTGVSSHWKDGAVLAEGAYMCIDQNKRVAHISAPQDKRIAELGGELNKTYIPYGVEGRAGAARQSVQDSNAAGLAKEVAVQRAVAKANAQYRNAHWDLVDAVDQGTAKIEEIKAEDLPENMRKMSIEERKAHVEAQTRRRAELQKEINELNGARKKVVAEEMKKLATDGKDTLDAAMIKTLRTQAEKRHFEFGDAEEAPEAETKKGA